MCVLYLWYITIFCKLTVVAGIYFVSYIIIIIIVVVIIIIIIIIIIMSTFSHFPPVREQIK